MVSVTNCIYKYRNRTTTFTTDLKVKVDLGCQNDDCAVCTVVFSTKYYMILPWVFTMQFGKFSQTFCADKRQRFPIN